MVRWLNLIVALTLLAGCTEAHNEEIAPLNPVNSNKPETRDSSVSSRPNELATSTLRMTDCSGAFSHTILPSVLVGANPPPTWGGGPTPATEIYVNVHTCARFSLDKFERGPITILYEVHDNRSPPVSCQGDYVSSEVLTQFWIDDLEIAEHLRSIYSMPARFANITTHIEEGQGQTTYTVTFAANDTAPSFIREVRPPDDSSITAELLYRRFWTNSVGGISFMDFQFEYTTNGQTPPVVTGELHAPFLYSNLGVPAYVAYGGFFDGGFIEAPIEQFSDLACETPLS